MIKMSEAKINGTIVILVKKWVRKVSPSKNFCKKIFFKKFFQEIIFSEIFFLQNQTVEGSFFNAVFDEKHACVFNFYYQY